MKFIKSQLDTSKEVVSFTNMKQQCLYLADGLGDGVYVKISPNTLLCINPGRVKIIVLDGSGPRLYTKLPAGDWIKLEAEA